MCDHALPGMCEHALPTWSEVIRDPSDFKEETLLHVLASRGGADTRPEDMVDIELGGSLPSW